MLTDDDYIGFVNSIAQAPDLSELFRRLQMLLDPYGLENITYLATQLPGFDPLDPPLMTTYHRDWVERYRVQNFIAVDPVALSAPRLLVPQDWAELKNRDAGSRAFFDEADDYGVGRNGMSFPIRGNGGDRALFTLTSNAKAKEWSLLRYRYLRDFQGLAPLIHKRVLELTGYRPEGDLSERELSCVLGLAKGRAPKQIANDLRISESAVRKHLNSARHKFGCINRSELVSEAVRRGLFS